MFENKQKAYEFYLDQKVEEELAKSMAQQHFPEDETEFQPYTPQPEDPAKEPLESDAETKSLLKSINDGITGLTGLFKTKSPESEPDPDDPNDPEFSLPEDGEVVGTVDIEELTKSLEYSKDARDGIEGVANFLAETMKAQVQLYSNLQKTVAGLEQVLKDNLQLEVEGEQEPVPLAKAIAAMSTQTAGPRSFIIPGKNHKQEQENQLPAFAEMTKTLDEGRAAQKITTQEREQANAAWRGGDVETVTQILQKAKGSA